MATQRKRERTYQAPEAEYLQKAVDAVKAALDPTQNRVVPSPVQDERMETEEISDENIT